MKRFSALYLMIFLSVFSLLAWNFEFFNSLLPGTDAMGTSFWDSGELMIVGVLLLLTLVIFAGIMLFIRLLSIVFRKLE